MPANLTEAGKDEIASRSKFRLRVAQTAADVKKRREQFAYLGVNARVVKSFSQFALKDARVSSDLRAELQLRKSRR